MPEPSIPSHEATLLGMKAWALVAGFAVVAFNARNYERMWSDAN